MWEKNCPCGTVIGDARPGAPSLSGRGGYATGVRTMEMVRKGVPDAKARLENGGFKQYDRPLTVEVWYPACADESHAEQAVYQDYLGRFDRNNLTPFTFPGRACRNAEPDAAHGPYPVIVISHGYPGSRFLLSNLGENLSTKGYVVFAIGHTDNTYEDFLPEGSMESALLHRSKDQRFLIDSLDALNAEGWLKGLLDVEKLGLVGFSMGGYGALRTLGAQPCESPFPGFEKLVELISEPGFYGLKNIRATVLFAPASFLLSDDSYDRITTPTLWLCGTADPMVYYPKVRSAWEKAAHSDRYLLSFENLGHNVANNPAPIEAMSADWTILHRWADPVWDTWRVNNVSQHFLTAYFDMLLKGDQEKASYFRVSSVRGSEAAQDAYWPGFLPETAAGLILEHLDAE